MIVRLTKIPKDLSPELHQEILADLNSVLDTLHLKYERFEMAPDGTLYGSDNSKPIVYAYLVGKSAGFRESMVRVIAHGGKGGAAPAAEDGE